MKKLIVIAGATATGKTALALQLAASLGTEILSADSRQLYREMTIGTAKPEPEELHRVKHHFIDVLSVGENFSAGDFEREALEVLASLYKKKDVAIVAGGTGFFIKALCEGLDAFPEVTDAALEKVEALWQTGGLEALQVALKQADPAYFSRVDTQNPMRMRRALEVCYSADQPYSFFLNREKPKRIFTPEYRILDLPRPELYQRIDHRVDQMVDHGLEAEVRSLEAFRDLPVLRTVGYSEWFDFFDGKMTRAECIDKIKQHSRNYAKRQITWLKNQLKNG